MSDYKPEEIAKRLDTGIPTGPELVKAAECIRGQSELIQMQARRIEAQDLELARAYADRDENARERDQLRRALDAIPWKEIEAALGNLKAMEYEIDWYPRGSEEVLGKLLALRKQEGEK